MFIPFTIWAKDIPGIMDEQLDTPSECMCGKECKLRDCLAVWTHLNGKDKYQWFAACHPSCITIHVIEGSA